MVSPATDYRNNACAAVIAGRRASAPIQQR